jgi:hypothetical protein
LVEHIELTQGKTALVDDIDKDLAKLRWKAHTNKSEERDLFYAVRNIYCDGKSTSIRMHRLIMERILGRKLKSGEQVDHIDSNGLNNSRDNLRLATNGENCQHRRKTLSETTSRFKGVSWHSRAEKWYAEIQFNGRQKSLGYFDFEEDAAKAYDRAALEYFGNYSLLNFPLMTYLTPVRADIWGYRTSVLIPQMFLYQ